MNRSIVAAMSGRLLPIVIAAMVAGVGCTVVQQPPSTSPPQQSPPSPASTPTPQQSPPPAATPTGTPTPRAGAPGTDKEGFVGTHATCDPGHPAAVIARTTKTLLVVCQTAGTPGEYYYRAVRISDGATIELPHAVRTSDGFDVTNPADGTRYQVRPKTVNIISPGGHVDSEPVIQFVSD